MGRLLNPAIQLDGFALWWEPSRVSKVLAALAAAPGTDRPSYFVRATSEALLIPCSTPAPYAPANFSVIDRAAALQNWYHALCAPESDPSWQQQFDPAEEPQQMALTAGFACIVACEANHRELDAKAMALLSAKPSAARDALCAALPWKSGGTDFRSVSNASQLASMSAPILALPCGCTGTIM